MRTLTELYNAYREANGSRGRPLSHRAAAERAENPGIYETFRQIGAGKHSGRIGEDTVQALVHLGLSERDVRLAAGHQLEQSPGPLVLPDRSARLTLPQRDVIVAVMDAILNAAEGRTLTAVPTPEQVVVEQQGRAMLDKLGTPEPAQDAGKRRRGDLP